MTEAEVRALLGLFNSATLRDLVDGNAERLPLDLPVDSPTQALATETLNDRDVLITRIKRRPSGVRFRSFLSERQGATPKRLYAPRWAWWLWVRPSRLVRFRRFRPSAKF